MTEFIITILVGLILFIGAIVYEISIIEKKMDNYLEKMLMNDYEIRAVNSPNPERGGEALFYILRSKRENKYYPAISIASALRGDVASSLLILYSQVELKKLFDQSHIIIKL